MKTFFSLICFASLISFCNLSLAKDNPVQIDAIDSIYYNAKIWTGVEGDNSSQAMAIQNGKIIVIGNNTKIKKLQNSNTALINLKGARVIPGLIDSHTHFILAGLRLGEIQLREVKTREAFIAKIKQKAASLPKGAWILGGSWDHELWGGELPNKVWIDKITPDHPVYLMRHAGHMTFANSLALKLAGIDKSTPNPVGGEIERDSQGNLTGIMKEAAKALVEKVIPATPHHALDAAFERSQALALSLGVTQIHNVYNWESFETFLRARDNGTLKMRVYSLTDIKNWRQMANYISQHGKGDDNLRWGGVKGYVDGALGASTAWFYQPYSDEPETSGYPRHNTADIKNWIMQADKAGLQVVVHAIGDKANDWLLDTFEEVTQQNGLRDRRFRIEHAQHLSPEAFPRFDKLGVIASMQPYHVIDDGRWAEKRIGPKRIKTSYAFRSLIDANARVTFGSDWFVAPLDPMTGIQAAVTRQTLDGAYPNGWVPEQIITVKEALTAYTRQAAYAGFQENKLGTLVVGKLADFIVLSDDILTIDVNNIADVKVIRTVIAGKEQYILQ
jgi:predicted amidohydrolase YtcJ